MNVELQQALNDAYVVFAAYKDSLRLAQSSGVSNGLHNLTREDWNLMNTKFDMGVLIYSDEAILFRHFLPRFLEWLSDDTTSPHWELWDLGCRLNHFHWLDWPSREVEALRRVFHAWTREIFTDDNAGMPIEFLIQIQEDLTFYLNFWLEARPRELADWLWTLDWKMNQNSWRWAVQPHVEAKLETEFFRHPNGEAGHLLSRTIDLLRSLRG